MGQQQRTEVTESLLVRHRHDNLINSEENGGIRVGDEGSVAGSGVTTILALSTFVGACSIWGLGCAVKCTGIFITYSVFNHGTLGTFCGRGAAICGKTTDLLGRKSTMWILNVFYISGWLAIAFTKVPWLLVLGRLSLGFTNGISGYLVPIYIAEITPKNLRGRFTAMVLLMSCWGMSFMYVVGSFVNWRILALTAIIPGILQLPILFFIPESPRWLAKVGREKEVEAALLCLRVDKADISNEATDIKEYVETLKSFPQGGILVVFQKEYVRPLLIVFGLMTLGSLGGMTAFAYYSGIIFVSAGISSMTGLVTLAAFQTLLGLLGTFLIDKSGRRPLLLVSSAGLCISTSLTGLSFFLKMYMGSNVVASGIPWLLIAELFPINVRGSAGSICSFIGGITGFAVAYYFNFLIEWSSAGLFFIFSAFCFANFILAATMKKAKKKGNQLWGSRKRTELTESLVCIHGHDNNLVYSEENGGVGVGGDGKSAASTTILALGAFVGASIAWGYGCALGYSSPTQSSIMEDLGLSVAEFSLFGSILNIGAIIGATISGKTTDLLGPRLTMWILNIFYISGWLAIVFTKVPWLLVLGRLSLGFTNGLSGYLAPVYIAEITPNNLRGRFTAMVPLINGWGMSFMYVVGSFINWRILALIATLSGLLQLPLLFFIPESKWLTKIGRDKELEAAQGGISELFQKKYVRPLLIVAGTITFLSLGGISAFSYYSGIIFVSAGVSSMTGLVAMAATQTVLGIIGAYLIDKSGRRPLLLVSSAGLCISTSLTGLSFFLKNLNLWSQVTPILALIGLLMYMGSFVVASGIPWLLIAELFPNNVKGAAGSICNLITTLAGLTVAYYFNFLIEWSSSGVFFIFSGFCYANFILAATMVPETKGRTLEEIQASITRSSD
ncbi:General substrate transporter [Corchorus olitorius]|uniref:General substrate transporter n=1 Tax=Corchorus olitorius TaxID=93759 RepID=A0A1R3JW37_9ROSI|nr:General substrate transporter [Corchorus olitorius]